ncbi:hypothetical protein [Salinibacter phage M31CR41-2]|uniref:Uncharacterized protein n=2 Tax=Kairosalinivirus TaxID=2560158 RepID=A0A2I6UH75_9CAUD|nr:hypothetical protein FGG68_gp40 [Salinibacter phage M31CR41-2]AUO79329.1 hypothetical protein [Salinibacter phage M31CR41-2]AUO79398.1 hypothetical protein [Salinibacter virus M31CR41-3]
MYRYGSDTDREFCCSSMEHATTSGTDSNGYGPAITVTSTSIYVGGMFDEEIEVCPWCGEDVEQIIDS